MPKIKKSVGKGGKNEKADVEIVQTLLNAFQKDCSFAKLKVDGDAGRKTQEAIGKFEALMGVKAPKQKAEPGSKVMADLNNPSATRKVIKALAAKAVADAAFAELEKQMKKAKIANEIAAEYKKKGITDVALIPRGKPKVTGDTSGVDKKLVTALEAISAHFGEPIRVTSGFRSATKQGTVMWDYWTINLDRGLIYNALKSDPVKRKKLDDYFNAKNKSDFVKTIVPDAKTYSRHARGQAIDIAKNTNAKVVKALGTVCRVLTENTCYHLDDRGKAFPAKITDELRRKWKR